MTINYSVSDKGIAQLNQFFTNMYDYKYWFYKLKTYDTILEDTEKFISMMGDEEFKKEPIEAYQLFLKGEIVFTFFHSTEALFSLIICCLNSPIPWVAMKNIRFEDICKYVREEIVTGNISDENIRFVFFHGCIGEEAKREDVKKSIAFIKDYLKRIGSRFLENEIYNAYKHGLRIMNLNATATITPEKVPNPRTFTILNGSSHIFLKENLVEKKGKNEYYQLEQTAKGFDHELYLRLAIYNFRLMSNFFETRKQAEKLKPGEQMKVTLFHQYDIKEVFQENPHSNSSFSITIN